MGPAGYVPTDIPAGDARLWILKYVNGLLWADARTPAALKSAAGAKSIVDGVRKALAAAGPAAAAAAPVARARALRADRPTKEVAGIGDRPIKEGASIGNPYPSGSGGGDPDYLA